MSKKKYLTFKNGIYGFEHINNWVLTPDSHPESPIFTLSGLDKKGEQVVFTLIHSIGFDDKEVPNVSNENYFIINARGSLHVNTKSPIVVEGNYGRQEATSLGDLNIAFRDLKKVE